MIITYEYFTLEAYFGSSVFNYVVLTELYVYIRYINYIKR